MSYIIRKTDGSILLSLADEAVDTQSTSLPLIGKNVSNYGEYYNNSLVGLLENFASTQQPNAPLIGQLWYDEADGTMKVYSINGLFEPVVTPIDNPATPQNSKTGDLWIDTTNDQLKFRSSGSEFVIAGPIYTKAQGIAGFSVSSVADVNGDSHDVSVMYNNNNIVGVLTHEAFVLRDPADLGGITNVLPGITLNSTMPGSVKFFGTASRADYATYAENFAGSINLSNLPPVFLTNFSGGSGAMDYTTGTLRILNDDGLKIGSNENIVFNASAPDIPNIYSNMIHNITDRPLRIQGKNSSVGYYTSFYLDSANRRVGIQTETPQAVLDVNGATIVRGNLSIVGSNYLIANDVRVIANNIELNYAEGGVNDTMAEGGGITLNGSTSHTILWSQTLQGSWNINDNLNLSNSTSAYMIADQTVITSSTIGIGIVDAPGIKTLGVLDFLTVTNVTITTGTISTIGIDVDLVLSPAGIGAVDVAMSKIINVSTCTNSLDAVNKKYVDDSLYQFASRFAFTIDETNMVDPPNNIIDYLNIMFPITNPFPYEPLNIPDGSRSRILCSVTSITIPEIPLSSTDRTVVAVDKNGIQNSTDVLQDISFKVPSTPALFNVVYTIREFLVDNGAWTYVGILT